MLDFLAYLVYLITVHKFIFMVFVFVVIFGSAIFLKKEKMGMMRWPVIILIAMMVLNFTFGSYANAALIHSVGETGAAQVTSVNNTGSQYNNHYIYQHNILIKTLEGQVIETSFESDDFNVYPVHNLVNYPVEGDRFNVRYLKHFPSAFVIIANDDSPWATSLNCTKLQKQLIEAQNKYQFDRNNQTYRQQYINLIQEVIKTRCYIDSLDLRKYYGDMDMVKQGKDLNTGNAQ